MPDRDDETTPARRRRIDPAALLVGLFSLGVAGTAMAGRATDLAAFDVRWLLAAAAVLLGVLLLVGSLRDRRRR